MSHSHAPKVSPAMQSTVTQSSLDSGGKTKSQAKPGRSKGKFQVVDQKEVSHPKQQDGLNFPTSSSANPIGGNPIVLKNPSHRIPKLSSSSLPTSISSLIDSVLEDTAPKPEAVLLSPPRLSRASVPTLNVSMGNNCIFAATSLEELTMSKEATTSPEKNREKHATIEVIQTVKKSRVRRRSMVVAEDSVPPKFLVLSNNIQKNHQLCNESDASEILSSFASPARVKSNLNLLNNSPNSSLPCAADTSSSVSASRKLSFEVSNGQGLLLKPGNDRISSASTCELDLLDPENVPKWIKDCPTASARYNERITAIDQRVGQKVLTSLDGDLSAGDKHDNTLSRSTGATDNGANATDPDTSSAVGHVSNDAFVGLNSKGVDSQEPDMNGSATAKHENKEERVDICPIPDLAPPIPARRQRRKRVASEKRFALDQEFALFAPLDMNAFERPDSSSVNDPESEVLSTLQGEDVILTGYSASHTTLHTFHHGGGGDIQCTEFSSAVYFCEESSETVASRFNKFETSEAKKDIDGDGRNILQTRPCTAQSPAGKKYIRSPLSNCVTGIKRPYNTLSLSNTHPMLRQTYERDNTIERRTTAEILLRDTFAEEAKVDDSIHGSLMSDSDNRVTNEGASEASVDIKYHISPFRTREEQMSIHELATDSPHRPGSEGWLHTNNTAFSKSPNNVGRRSNRIQDLSEVTLAKAQVNNGTPTPWKHTPMYKPRAPDNFDESVAYTLPLLQTAYERFSLSGHNTFAVKKKLESIIQSIDRSESIVGNVFKGALEILCHSVEWVPTNSTSPLILTTFEEENNFPASIGARARLAVPTHNGVEVTREIVENEGLEQLSLFEDYLDALIRTEKLTSDEVYLINERNIRRNEKENRECLERKKKSQSKKLAQPNDQLRANLIRSPLRPFNKALGNTSFDHDKSNPANTTSSPVTINTPPPTTPLRQTQRSGVGSGRSTLQLSPLPGRKNPSHKTVRFAVFDFSVFHPPPSCPAASQFLPFQRECGSLYEEVFSKDTSDLKTHYTDRINAQKAVRDRNPHLQTDYPILLPTYTPPPGFDDNTEVGCIVYALVGIIEALDKLRKKLVEGPTNSQLSLNFAFKTPTSISSGPTSFPSNIDEMDGVHQSHYRVNRDIDGHNGSSGSITIQSLGIVDSMLRILQAMANISIEFPKSFLVSTLRASMPKSSLWHDCEQFADNFHEDGADSGLDSEDKGGFRGRLSFSSTKSHTSRSNRAYLQLLERHTSLAIAYPVGAAVYLLSDMRAASAYHSSEMMKIMRLSAKLPYTSRLSSAISSAVRFQLRRAFNPHRKDPSDGHVEDNKAPVSNLASSTSLQEVTIRSDSSVSFKKQCVGNDVVAQHSVIMPNKMNTSTLAGSILSEVHCGGIGRGGGGINYGYVFFHSPTIIGTLPCETPVSVNIAQSISDFERALAGVEKGRDMERGSQDSSVAHTFCEDATTAFLNKYPSVFHVPSLINPIRGNPCRLTPFLPMSKLFPVGPKDSVPKGVTVHENVKNLIACPQYNSDDLASVVFRALNALVSAIELIEHHLAHNFFELLFQVNSPFEPLLGLKMKESTILKCSAVQKPAPSLLDILSTACVETISTLADLSDAHTFLRCLFGCESVHAAVCRGGDCWTKLRILSNIADEYAREDFLWLRPLSSPSHLIEKLNEEGNIIDSMGTIIGQIISQYAQALGYAKEKQLQEASRQGLNASTASQSSSGSTPYSVRNPYPSSYTISRVQSSGSYNVVRKVPKQPKKTKCKSRTPANTKRRSARTGENFNFNENFPSPSILNFAENVSPSSKGALTDGWVDDEFTDIRPLNLFPCTSPKDDSIDSGNAGFSTSNLHLDICTKDLATGFANDRDNTSGLVNEYFELSRMECTFSISVDRCKGNSTRTMRSRESTRPCHTGAAFITRTGAAQSSPSPSFTELSISSPTLSSARQIEPELSPDEAKVVNLHDSPAYTPNGIILTPPPSLFASFQSPTLSPAADFTQLENLFEYDDLFIPGARLAYPALALYSHRAGECSSTATCQMTVLIPKTNSLAIMKMQALEVANNVSNALDQTAENPDSVTRAGSSSVEKKPLASSFSDFSSTFATRPRDVTELTDTANSPSPTERSLQSSLFSLSLDIIPISKCPNGVQRGRNKRNSSRAERAFGGVDLIEQCFGSSIHASTSEAVNGANTDCEANSQPSSNEDTFKTFSVSPTTCTNEEDTNDQEIGTDVLEKAKNTTRSNDLPLSPISMETSAKDKSTLSQVQLSPVSRTNAFILEPVEEVSDEESVPESLHLSSGLSLPPLRTSLSSSSVACTPPAFNKHGSMTNDSVSATPLSEAGTPLPVPFLDKIEDLALNSVSDRASVCTNRKNSFFSLPLTTSPTSCQGNEEEDISRSVSSRITANMSNKREAPSPTYVCGGCFEPLPPEVASGDSSSSPTSSNINLDAIVLICDSCDVRFHSSCTRLTRRALRYLSTYEKKSFRCAGCRD